MAMWPPKPKIIIYLELRQIVWQFPRQIRGFRPRPARRNRLWAIATTTGNRKLQYTFCATIVQFLVVDRCRNHLANLWSIRAGHHQKSQIWRWNFDAICQSSRDVIIFGFGGHIDISGCRSCCRVTCQNYFPPAHGLIPQICRWNFNCTCHSFRDISISGFGHRFRLLAIIGIA